MWYRYSAWCFTTLLMVFVLANATPQSGELRMKRSLWDGFFSSSRHHPDHGQSGSSAGSSAQAGSSAGSIGGHGHSQSNANAQSYSSSFNAGPFSASFSNSQAQSSSNSGGGYGDWLFGGV